MKVIIYGAGTQGRAASRVLRSQCIEAYGFADKDYKKYSNGYEGLKVLSPSDLRDMKREDTAVIIGIGAQRVETLCEIDTLLTGWGFKKIYWSAVELIEDLFPEIAERGLLPQAIEVTTKVGCSIRCKACPQNLFVREYTKRLAAKNGNKDYYMTFGTFKICIDKLPPKSFVGFGGFGEPFENPDCIDMIIYAFKKGHRVAVSTTCVGLTLDGLEKLKKEKVVFSVCVPHFPSDEMRENIEITEEYLKVVDEFLKSFALNSSCEIFTKGYYSCHGQIRRELIPVVESHGFNTNNKLHRLTTRAGNIDMPWCETMSKQAHLNSVNKIVCDRRRNENSKQVTMDDLNYYMTVDVGVSLLPNGEVALCCMDYGLTQIFGNLARQTFEEVFTGKEINSLSNLHIARDKNKASLCYRCECAKDAKDYEIVSRRTHLKEG